ncbi:MAG TPA: hypothetical protein VN969_38205 [Streptosporangiaceae bacterium]|nr:hypothetical protein [Streptosporangiaceae bacterium]
MRRPRMGRWAIGLGTAVFLALVVAGVMTGSVFQAVLSPPAAAAPAVGVASQCQSLPVAASPSASASASASPAPAAPSPGQLCVSVQANQASVKPGGSATWTVQIWAQGGSAPGVTVSLATTPAGLGATFGSGCPSGTGTGTCTVGDMATALAPSSYVLQAQLTVPTSSTAGTVTLTAAASAATAAAMTDPAAGETLTVVHPASSPSPAGKKTTPAQTPAATTPAATTPAASQVSQAPAPPVASDEPALGGAPSIPAASTTVVPAGNVASVLPIITPDPVSTPDVVISTPAANIQDIPAPASSSAQAGTFTLTIGMPAHTAETLGLIIFALALTLMAIRFVATHFGRSRHPAVQIIPPSASRTRQSKQPGQPGQNRLRVPLSGIHVPSVSSITTSFTTGVTGVTAGVSSFTTGVATGISTGIRTSHTRFTRMRLRRSETHGARKAERRAAREQAWRRHLEGERGGGGGGERRAIEPAAPPPAPAPKAIHAGDSSGDTTTE